MVISEFKKIDPNTMTFGEIFSIYDENFEKMRDAFDREGDKIYQEEPVKTGSNTVRFERGFSYGKNQLIVFYNGAIQFTPEDYIQLDEHRIRFTFDISDDDEIHGIIIEVSQEANSTASLYREMQAYYNDMKEVLNNYKSELEALYSNMKDLEERLKEYDSRATTKTAVDIDIAKGGFGSFYERSAHVPLIYNTLSDVKNDARLRESDLILMLGENNVGDIGKGLYVIRVYAIESGITESYYPLDRDNLYLIRIVSM